MTEVSITYKETATSFSITFHFSFNEKGSLTQTFFLTESPTIAMSRSLSEFIDSIFGAHSTDWLNLTKETEKTKVMCKFEIQKDYASFYVKECNLYGFEIRRCSINMTNMDQFNQLYDFLNALKTNWLIRSH